MTNDEIVQRLIGVKQMARVMMAEADALLFAIVTRDNDEDDVAVDEAEEDTPTETLQPRRRATFGSRREIEENART